MDEELNVNPTPRPRRRRKTKMEIIKEAYLPYLFLLIATVLVLIFIIGALVRGANDDKSKDSDGDSAFAVSSCYDSTEL